MNSRLRITLYVIAVYLALLGIVFLFAPGVMETVMQAKLADAALNMLYGQVVLTFAYVAYMAAQTGESHLSRAVLALTAGHVVILGYQLFTGMQGFPQAGPPLIINLIFTVLQFLFR